MFSQGQGIEFAQDGLVGLVTADKLGDWVAADHIHLVKCYGRNYLPGFVAQTVSRKRIYRINRNFRVVGPLMLAPSHSIS